MAISKGPPQQPALPWRIIASVVTGLTGTLSKGFLYGFNRVEVIGLGKFLEVLDKRKNVEQRQRGLITGAFGAHVPHRESLSAYIETHS